MEERLITVFRNLLMIDTSNPPGGEEEACIFLESLFKSYVEDIRIISSAPKRANLFVKIKGKRISKPIILLNHLDTVPAREEEWTVDPFSAEIKDGFIYGRGAIDMKSQIICTALSLIELLKEGILPERDIIFLATADEECGGTYGIEYLLRTLDEIRNPLFVLSEGGFIIEQDGRYYGQISCAEKKLAQFFIRAKGTGGHGSTPHSDNPNEKILKAANAILSYKPPIKISSLSYRYLNALLKGKRIKGYEFQDLKKAIKNKAFLKFLEEEPSLNALLRNTIALTILKGGEKINVIPSFSEAYFDARLLPKEDHGRFFKKIRSLIGEEIELITLKEGFSDPLPSSFNTKFFRLIGRIIKERMGEIEVLPYLTAGATDLRFFRNLGVPSYGFFFLVISKEELKRMHGPDERISIESLKTAFLNTKELIRSLFLLQ